MHRYSDLAKLDTNEIEEILLLVQLQTYDYYKGSMFDRSQMEAYICKKQTSTIETTATLNIYNLETRCHSTRHDIRQFRDSLKTCFQNDNNTINCLLRQSKALRNIQESLTVCDIDKIEHVQEKFDHKLAEFIQQKTKRLKCENDMCHIKQQREKAFETLANLENMQI
jgi:hypothetical protein